MSITTEVVKGDKTSTRGVEIRGEKTFRVKHYDGGWHVHVSIGDRDPKGVAQAAIRFGPEEAEEAGNLLIEFAQFAREARD